MANDDKKPVLEIVSKPKIKLTPVGDLIGGLDSVVDDSDLTSDTSSVGELYSVSFSKSLYIKKNFATNGTVLDEIAKNLNPNGIYGTSFPFEPINGELLVAAVIGLEQYVADVTKTTFFQEDGKVVLTNGDLELHVYDLDKHIEEYDVNVLAAIKTDDIPFAKRFRGAGKMAFNESGPFNIGFYVVEE